MGDILQKRARNHEKSFQAEGRWALNRGTKKGLGNLFSTVFGYHTLYNAGGGWQSLSFFAFFCSGDGLLYLFFVHDVPWFGVMIMLAVEAVVQICFDHLIAWAVTLNKVVGFVIEFADRFFLSHATDSPFK